MAKLTGTHLQAQQVREITIASRTLATTQQLARHFNGRAVSWNELDAALSAADIVVTATGATEPVLTRHHVEAVMRPRRGRPLFIIDIALPRDVETVGRRSRSGVPLQHRRSADDRAGEPRAPEQRTGAGRVDRRRGGRQVRRVDAVARDHPDGGRAATALRSDSPVRAADGSSRKLAGLPPDARARLEEITHLIVEKLLLTPTEQLKAVNDETMVVAYSDALNRLFSLADEPAAAVPAQSEEVAERRSKRA